MKRISPGEQHGELTAVKRIPQDSLHTTRWLCRCSCGNDVTIVGFRTSPVISCGCKTPTGRKYIRSGKSNTPMYWVWKAMMNRCYKPNNPAYRHYGGRGIFVCKRWHDFRTFL